MYVVVFVSVVCLLLYFLLRGLVQYRQDSSQEKCRALLQRCCPLGLGRQSCQAER
eukprot:COSAG05_NODE_19733_length_288_cov_1.079365_1_plen_54_part_10